MLPEELVAIVETDPWNLSRTFLHYRQRFSLEFQLISTTDTDFGVEIRYHFGYSCTWHQNCDWPCLAQGLPARNPGESEKSPERVPRARAPKVPKERARSLTRVRKESKSQVLDFFRTLLRLWGALFRDCWGSDPGCSFRTLFGLFRFFGPEGPGRPCVGRGQSQHQKPKQSAQAELAPGQVVFPRFSGNLPGQGPSLATFGVGPFPVCS